MKYKLILLFGLLNVMSSLCFSQQKACVLDIKDSPSLRGIKLGMKKAEVEASLGFSLKVREFSTLLDPQVVSEILPNKDDPHAGKVVEKYKHKSSTSASSLDDYLDVPNGAFLGIFRPNESLRSSERFKDIIVVTLGLYQDRVYSISILYYTHVFKDATEEEFDSDMSALLSLPKGVFLRGYASCNNFSVLVSNSKSSISISVSDTITQRTLKENAKQKVKETYEKFKNEKANSKGFKP